MTQERKYTSGPFNDITSDWGERLWEFLNEPSNLVLMKNASDIGMPAAESVALELYKKFGEDIKQDRVKQFLGFLIRQVMEGVGYQHSFYGKKTQEKSIFSSASVYSQRED